MGAPRQQQPEHVAQIVPGIRNERDRVREHAEYDLCDYECNVERRSDGKSATEIRRLVIAYVVAVIFVVSLLTFSRMLGRDRKGGGMRVGYHVGSGHHGGQYKQLIHPWRDRSR